MDEAIALLSSFQQFSHCKSKMMDFRRAAKMIYGQEWDVELDSGQRMQFLCIACNKIMNHVKSMSDHNRSGMHLKNIRVYKPVLARKYLNLHDMLESTNAKAIGLQMVEEFCVPGKLYYKCILCGNHGKMQAMYDHVVGGEHMKKYINMRLDYKAHFMSVKQREDVCTLIINMEGTRISEIKQITGEKYFPYRWMLESSN
ncbi:uncharacterized protein LOC125041564 isoform X1 [Penaeus chinensis]|uniref:uncharacterized protein LOC125041564 isoform X1 n=2 Tax=Penaeus chinensis TaxID=139456 RepID=UPI001FB65DF2|nr:uncharacterized protein LOC125041564 isoform X1 [Penaeus chinensis]